MLLPVYGYWYVVTGMYLGPHLSLFFSLFLFYFFAVYGRYYRILQSLTSHPGTKSDIKNPICRSTDPQMRIHP